MSSSRPNVLFLLSDEHSFRFQSRLNPDTVGEPCRTPTLDALAMRGVAFETAYCQMPLCTPSRMCMLTGLQAQRCGAIDNGSVLDPALPTLPKAFRDAGYETCLVGKMHFGGNLQHHGFNHRPYGDLTGGAGHQADPLIRPADTPNAPMAARTCNAGVTALPESQLQDRLVAEETLAFLREHTARQPAQPWFCCASFSRPHFPLTAPSRHFHRYWPDRARPPKVGRTGDAADHPMTRGAIAGFNTQRITREEMLKARAAYTACVDTLDEVLGDLLRNLDASGLLDNTIVVYTSDHGELAGEHGLWWKHTWHEAAVRVPLILQTPAHRRGERPAVSLQAPVSLGDLFPTLCGLADVAYPKDLDGVDLTRCIHDGREPASRPIACDNLSHRWGPGTAFRAVRYGPYKYVAFDDAPELLFNLETDPFEQTNLMSNAATGKLAVLLKNMRAFVADNIDLGRVEEWAAQDAAMRKKHAAETPACGNVYHLPDGRLIDAERSLYDPRVVARFAIDSPDT